MTSDSSTPVTPEPSPQDHHVSPRDQESHPGIDLRLGWAIGLSLLVVVLVLLATLLFMPTGH